MVASTETPNNSNGLLHLQAIGEPRIAIAGTEVAFPTRHAAQALFLLALDEDGELPVPELGEQLWPDAATSQIPPRFATMVWQLRRGLGEHRDLLERNRRIIRVDRSQVSVDIVNLRSDAQQLIAKGAKDDALAKELKKPILVTWDDYPWVQEQQEINGELAAQLSA